MRKKIFSFMCLTALLAILLTSFSIMLLYYKDVEARIKSSVKVEADYIKDAIDSGGYAYLQRLESTDKRVTLIAPNGEVLFDNRVSPEDMENHYDRAEVLSAVKSGYGESERISDTLSEKIYYYALLLPDGCILRVAYTNDTFIASISGILPWLVLIALITGVFSIAAVSFLTGRIVAPINSIDLEHPENNVVYDELSPLLSKLSRQNTQISEQMQILKEKQQEFTAITENMSEGFIVIDKNTDILSYNSGALKLLHANITDEIKSVFALNRSESFRNAVETALKGSKNERLLQIGSLSYQIIANPVYNDENIAGAVILILDVTEKESREKLRREFTANVSHELKTPLTSILGFSELMQNGLVKQEDIPRFAGNIHDEAERLIVLVEDILKLSHLDEGAITGKRETVDLYDVSRSVLTHLKQAAEKRNIRLELFGKKTEVMGDPKIIEEMIANLCDNSIKYNKDGGSVRVTVFNDSTGPGISVSDTGIGIPYDQQQRVFERFYRVDKSHSKDIGGTGLGLSIVKHGAMYHGAGVSLESTPGVGTKVTILWQSKSI